MLAVESAIGAEALACNFSSNKPACTNTAATPDRKLKANLNPTESLFYGDEPPPDQVLVVLVCHRFGATHPKGLIGATGWSPVVRYPGGTW
jgi:hypothetical protein